MSAALKVQDPNRGPLTLQHDCTPRDLTRFDPAIDGAAEFRLTGDFRFKGWPERHFVRSRKPVRRTKDELSLERAKLAGLPVDEHKDLPKDQPAQETEKVEPRHSSQKDVEVNPSHTQPAEQTISADDPDKAQGSASSTSLSRYIRDPYSEKTPAEVAKIQHQMFEADQDILRFKQERIQKMKEETEAKRRDLEMLQSYDPFGKPGGGAPPVNGVKKQKFLEEDLTPREQPRYRKPVQSSGPPGKKFSKGSADFFNFGRPGGGAPLKTDSGSIVTSIQGDPTIRFQGKEDLRQSIENHIRYHKPNNETEQYNHELDKQIKEKKVKEHLQRLEDLKKEIDMMKHNPYGRPGAGAPNRTESGTQLIGRRNIPADGQRALDGSSPVHMKNSHSSDGDYDPWGKGALQPVRLEDGSIVRHKNYLSNKYASQIRDGDFQGTSLELGSSGGGAPHIGDNGQVITRLPVTMNANDFGQNVIKEELAGPVGKKNIPVVETKSQAYFPFGRPGAGAPRRDEEGRILTTVARKLTRETSSADDLRRARAAQLYHRDLAKGMEEQKRHKQEDENYLKAPVGELASVLREGQVGKPRRDPVTGMLLAQPLRTSDVTQLKINDINYRAAQNSKDYHQDLTKAAEERYRSRELEKLKEKQEAKHHEQVFSEFWGRPGAGAPRTTGDYRKANLDDSLFAKKQHMHAGDWDYVKNKGPLTSRSTGHLDNLEFQRYMDNRSRGPIGDTDGNQKYVRNTIQSTHANQYDLDSSQKRSPRVYYKIDAPWAAM